MTLFDRRLLAYKDDAVFERPSLINRMCEYQRDIQDIERKWNKCNQILRKPLIPIPRHSIITYGHALDGHETAIQGASNGAHALAINKHS